LNFELIDIFWQQVFNWNINRIKKEEGMTYFLSPEQIDLAKHPERYHADPEAYIAEVVAIIERNAKCEKCGEQTIKVLSYEKKHLKCENCGFEKKSE